MADDLREIVYVLTNEAMPGYVKVGRTQNLEQRMKQLDTTGVPLPFECYYARRVSNADFVEAHIFEAFNDQLVRKNREFLTIRPERIKAALQIAPGEDVTVKETSVVESQDDLDALARAKTARKDFHFSMIGVQPGTVLTHSRDPTVTCTVYDDRKVTFEGEVMSLSKSAGIVLQRHGLSPDVAGTAYWTYKGKTLWDLRLEMEAEE